MYSIVDLPDNISAAALAMHVTAAGMSRCDVTVLLSTEEVDKAARTKMWYRPPGA